MIINSETKFNIGDWVYFKQDLMNANKYDPIKLYSIWKKKLETRDKRHQEMMNSVISDFYEIDKDISDSYKALEKHIDRIRSSYEKYGK